MKRDLFFTDAFECARILCWSFIGIGGEAVCACGSSSYVPRVAVAPEQVILASCSTAASTVLHVSNAGDAPLTFEVTLVGQPIFWHEPAGGTIQPSASETLTVTATPPSMHADDVYSGLLVLDTNDPLHPSIRIPLRLDTHGAELTYSLKELDFGDLPLGASAPIAFSAHNSGNAPATASLPVVMGGFSLAWFGGQSTPLAPGTDLLVTATFAPTAIGDRFVDWSPTAADGTLCPSPGPRLKGRGVDGVVGVTPGSVDFGLVGCGRGVGLTRTFSILNVSKSAFNFNAVLANGQGSLFAISPTNGSVPAESKLDVTMTLNGMAQTALIMPDTYADTVTVTTDAPKDQPHSVAIHITAQGAMLDWVPASIDLQNQYIGATPTTTLSVKNDGNLDATVDIGVFAPFTGSTQLKVSSGQTTGTTVALKVDPQPLGVVVSSPATMTVVGDTPVCLPVPSPATLKFTPYDKAGVVGVGRNHMCATGATDGIVYCWGVANNFGQLGDGTTTAHDNPVPVTGTKDATAFALSPNGTCAITKQQQLYCWGQTFDGSASSSVASYVSGPLSTVKDVVVGVAGPSAHGCALGTQGGVECWGSNNWGELGDGTKTSRGNLASVSGLSDAVAIAASSGDGGGTKGTCAVKQAGGVVCWGSNYWQALGNAFPNVILSTTPIGVPGISDAVDIAGGRGGYCVRRTGSAKLSCWGNNLSNQLATARPPDDSAMPVDVSGVGSPSLIAHGDDHACAVDQGSVKCWGANYFGQLLGGMTQTSAQPLVIQGLANVSFIKAAADRTAAISGNATALLWWGFDPKTNMATPSLQSVPGLD